MSTSWLRAGFELWTPRVTHFKSGTIESRRMIRSASLRSPTPSMPFFALGSILLIIGHAAVRRMRGTGYEHTTEKWCKLDQPSISSFHQFSVLRLKVAGSGDQTSGSRHLTSLRPNTPFFSACMLSTLFWKFFSALVRLSMRWMLQTEASVYMCPPVVADSG